MQKKPKEEMPGREAQGPALGVVERFCSRMGIMPAQFLSARGWVLGRSWQRAIDWRGMASTGFGRFVLQNLAQEAGSTTRPSPAAGRTNRVKAGRMGAPREGAERGELKPMEAVRVESGAPKRPDAGIYRISVVEPAAGKGDWPLTISVFEVACPKQIRGISDFFCALHERPAGFSVTRIGEDGKRAGIGPKQLDQFEEEMIGLRFDPHREIVISRPQAGRKE